MFAPEKSTHVDDRTLGQLVLSFRHLENNGASTMVEFPVVDQWMGELLFEYFKKMGVPVKLLEKTGRADLNIIVREGNRGIDE